MSLRSIWQAALNQTFLFFLGGTHYFLSHYLLKSAFSFFFGGPPGGLIIF